MMSLTGEYLPVEGETFVSIGRGMHVRTIVVTDMETPMIIGADVLMQAGSCLDFESMTATIMGRRYPYILKKATPDAAAATIELPTVTNDVLKGIIESNRDVFGEKGMLGECTLPAVTIETEDSRPIRQRAYRLPYTKRSIIEAEVHKMLNQGIIVPSASPWASPVTLVPKKDGETRFCVDYRKLNSVTVRDAHPLPHIHDIFDALGGANIFSTLDLRSGYWQIPVAPKDRLKTAFTCHLGLFEFNRLPFGLTNAPAQFQRVMNFVLADLIGVSVLVYIDDIVVYSRDPNDHGKHLQQVFDRLRKYNLTLKASKCDIGKTQVELLGYIITPQGITPQPRKTEAINNMPPPQTVREVRSFLGMASYYRQSVHQFAHVAEPLTKLTRKGEPFIWGDDQREAFHVLKQALVSPPVLAYPNTNEPYALHTDASQYAVGAILTQVQEGKERVIAYLSHQLSHTQKRWATIEREAYAVIYALDHLKEYLWGAKFTIYTDHKPLTSLFRAEIRNTKIQRWGVVISEFGAPIKFRAGKYNLRADLLSRINVAASVQAPNTHKTQIYPEEVKPLPWKAYGLDPGTMADDQKCAFPDCWRLADQGQGGYVINHGYLYSERPPTSTDEAYLRLLLPCQYQHKAMELAHHQVGHQGLIKTLTQIRQFFVWPGMRRAIENYVTSCPLCLVYNTGKRETIPDRMPIPPRPLHTWGLDLTGPFEAAIGTRNKYLLTCIDHFTGWAEAIPIRDKTNKSVWEAFMQLVSRYGLPEIIITDQGGEFNAHAFTAWLKETNIQHHKTTPYHPQSNGRTERFNRTLKAILAKIMRNDLAEWEQCLPEALYAYRISAHASLGYAPPYRLLYGVEPRQPAQVIPGVPMSERYARLLKARQVAREAQEVQAQRNFDRRNKAQASVKPLHIGDGVALRENAGVSLQSKWNPGFVVVAIRGSVVIVEKEGTTRTVNRDKVKLVPLDFVEEYISPRHRRRLKNKPQWTSQTQEGGLKLRLKRVAEVQGVSDNPTVVETNTKSRQCVTKEWSSWLCCVSSMCNGVRHKA